VPQVGVFVAVGSAGAAVTPVGMAVAVESAVVGVAGTLVVTGSGVSIGAVGSAGVAVESVGMLVAVGLVCTVGTAGAASVFVLTTGTKVSTSKVAVARTRFCATGAGTRLPRVIVGSPGAGQQHPKLAKRGVLGNRAIGVGGVRRCVWYRWPDRSRPSSPSTSTACGSSCT